MTQTSPDTKNYFLDDRTFAEFQNYIYELTGITYTDSKRYLLDSRIRKRAGENNKADGNSYLDFLKNSPDGKKEIEELIDQVSTHETSFFRHENQIEIFTQIVRDLVAARRTQGPKRLRLWSAACSSGEEPYTLGMVIKELLTGETGWDVSIKATDISAPVVAKAQAAQYIERNIRGIPEPYATKYVRPGSGPNDFTLDKSITDLVSFEAASLLDGGKMRQIRDVDIIICRNVLIYFDADAKKKVLDALWQSLVPGGFLILGPSESLHGLTDVFQRTPHSVYNFFQRPAAAATASTTSSAAVKSAAAPAPTAPSAPSAPSAAATPATTPRQSLRMKMLVNRLDGGVRDLGNDIENSLGKTIDSLSSLGDVVYNLLQNEELNGQARNELASAERQLARILLYLQVGDRAQQKMEAVRALLQELSDHLFGAEKEAPDLRVKTTAFDKNILANAQEDKGATDSADESMSQDEIDALFG